MDNRRMLLAAALTVPQIVAVPAQQLELIPRMTALAQARVKQHMCRNITNAMKLLMLHIQHTKIPVATRVADQCTMVTAGLEICAVAQKDQAPM
jgi:hypothetical protein